VGLAERRLERRTPKPERLALDQRPERRAQLVRRDRPVEHRAESLGFEVKEPTLYLRGRPLAAHPRAVEVRPLGEDDLDECARLCRAVHGIERTNELRDGLGGALVAHRSGRLTGYAVVSYGGHGIAESEEDLWAILVAAGEAGGDIGFLLPTRQAGLLRRCLAAGIRGVEQMTLMARGEYQEPRGSWFPSVWY